MCREKEGRMKQIVFTVSRSSQFDSNLTIRTKSIFADQSDREKETKDQALFVVMYYLTQKYNDKGIAVLFEVD